jgi:hypothetical protein
LFNWIVMLLEKLSVSAVHDNVLLSTCYHCSGSRSCFLFIRLSLYSQLMFYQVIGRIMYRHISRCFVECIDF